MKSTLKQALQAILSWEGGYVNDPDDPGGETKYGISKRAYPDLDISSLTRDGARRIYRRDYWEPCGCDELPFGLDLIVFDTGVNCGTDRAVLILQEVVGAKQDSIFGPKTKAAALSADAGKALWEYVARRAIYYTDLSIWDDFGLGWMRRLSDMHQRATRLLKTKREA